MLHITIFFITSHICPLVARTKKGVAIIKLQPVVGTAIVETSVASISNGRCSGINMCHYHSRARFRRINCRDISIFNSREVMFTGTIEAAAMQRDKDRIKNMARTSMNSRAKKAHCSAVAVITTSTK